MNVDELLDPSSLPDDLKWISAHYKLHPEDPVYLLLAWHWRRIQKTEDSMRSAAMEMKASLDNNHSENSRIVDTITRLEGTLANVQAAMETKPSQWEAQIQAPLTGAIKEAKQVELVLQPLAGLFVKAHQRQTLAVFVTGVCCGLLGALALFLG